MDLALYNPSNDSTMAAGIVVAFTLGAIAAMQNCTNEEFEETSSPAPSTPTPAKRPKKVTEEMASELKPMIVDFLQKNPGSSVKTMLNMFSRQMPEVTKTNINSCLYTMLNKKQVMMKEDGKDRLWFVLRK